MPGKPGVGDGSLLGEVSLKNDAPPGTTYLVKVHDGAGSCTLAGILRTNNEGNGNAHIAIAGGPGTYYVVLQDMTGQEKYATIPVTLS
ncbi:MAG: hypothetical protein NVS3B26_10030 [Mycobacteriales bacterium]